MRQLIALHTYHGVLHRLSLEFGHHYLWDVPHNTPFNMLCCQERKSTRTQEQEKTIAHLEALPDALSERAAVLRCLLPPAPVEDDENVTGSGTFVWECVCVCACVCVCVCVPGVEHRHPSVADLLHLAVVLLQAG